MKIREIKSLRKFNVYIDSNSKSFQNFQFVKLRPHKIKAFYSILR